MLSKKEKEPRKRSSANCNQDVTTPTAHRPTEGQQRDVVMIHKIKDGLLRINDGFSKRKVDLSRASRLQPASGKHALKSALPVEAAH